LYPFRSGLALEPGKETAMKKFLKALLTALSAFTV
jgi:hypothetical protein